MGSIIWTYLIDKSMAYPEFPNHDDFTAISKVLAGECEVGFIVLVHQENWHS